MFWNSIRGRSGRWQTALRLSIALALAVAAGATAAATLQVDAAAGTDNATCGASTGAGACKTINYAVNSRAAAADTIQAAAGSYPEQVSIPVALSGLTLRGAQAGVDARTRSASETILDGTGGALATGITIDADNTTVDGFTIRNYTGDAGGFGYGIVQHGATSGSHVVNNILSGNGYTGLYMGCKGTTQCVAQHNLFDANQNGSIGGDGIYNDFGTVSVLIDANKFSNHINGSVIITGVASTTQDNITISNNVSVNDGLLAVFGATHVTIKDNIATNPVAGIRVDGSQHVSVTGNAILGGANTVYYAFRASNNNGFPNPVDDVTITGNTFLAGNYGVLVTNNFATPNDPEQGAALANANSLTLQCNRIVGNTSGGLFNAANQPSVTATRNWWGCNAGPNQSGCDNATGPNTNNPWLKLTLAATPNPVTIGGNSQLTASLNTDSNGATASCSPPDITPIAFAASSGTIANAATHTSTGNAGATYMPTAPGSANVSATVDNQTVSLPLVTNPLQADLQVSKSGPAAAMPGNSVVYTIIVKNNGPDTAQGVSLADPTPAGLTFVSISGSGCSTLPCALGTLASGAQATLTATYTVQNSASGSIANTASAASATGDPNPANNAATATMSISPVADMTAAISLPASASAGSTVNGSYTCTNNGPSAASNASCTISGLPAGMTSSCSPASPVATLAAGASIACTFSFVAPASGTVTSTVTAASAISDPNPVNNATTATLSIVAAPASAPAVPAPTLSVLGMLTMIAQFLVCAACTRPRRR